MRVVPHPWMFFFWLMQPRIIDFTLQAQFDTHVMQCNERMKVDSIKVSLTVQLSLPRRKAHPDITNQIHYNTVANKEF